MGFKADLAVDGRDPPIFIALGRLGFIEVSEYEVERTVIAFFLLEWEYRLRELLAR